MDSVAVLGGGVSGLAAAGQLGKEFDVTVYEKKDRVSGRAKTKRRNGVVFDCGANYLGIGGNDSKLYDLIEGTSEEVVDIEGDVWIFDREGQISRGKEKDELKLSFRDGIECLGKVLFDRSETEVRLSDPVETLTSTEDGWVVKSRTEKSSYSLVVNSVPPFGMDGIDLELTNRIDEDAGADRDGDGDNDLTPAELRELYGGVEYRSVVCYGLRYSFEPEVPWYGLVNVDKCHDVGWVSREEFKGGHVPDGTLLVVQMSPEWSGEYISASESERKNMDGEVPDRIAELLDEDRFEEPDWIDVEVWRNALPDNQVGDSRVIERCRQTGLYHCGDWLEGKGRLSLAADSGFKTAEKIQDKYR
ncbi:MAG: NAD(P)-binding protein [Halobacteria archaeon]